MLDLASALGLEIVIATVRSNIAVIVILDCSISILLGISIHLDQGPWHYRRSEKLGREHATGNDESFWNRMAGIYQAASLTASAFVDHNSAGNRLLGYLGAILFFQASCPI